MMREKLMMNIDIPLLYSPIEKVSPFFAAMYLQCNGCGNIVQ
jgi:hypothetical protein